MTRRTVDTSRAERLDFAELWADLLALRGSPTAKLSDWDKEFCTSIRDRVIQYGERIKLTDKQRAKLDEIHAKNYPASEGYN